MTSTAIDAAFVKHFQAEVVTAYQQIGSKLRSTVRSKNNVVGVSTTFQLIGKGNATTKERNGVISAMEIEHKPVECVLTDYYAGAWVDKLDELKYTESGKGEIAKGYIGNLCGWEILVSNNIAQPEDGVFYPLFGVKDKTLAGGVSSDLNTIYYTPEKNFNTCYKGYGLYGVGAPRADMLGTVKISAPLTVSA